MWLPPCLCSHVYSLVLLVRKICITTPLRTMPMTTKESQYIRTYPFKATLLGIIFQTLIVPDSCIFSQHVPVFQKTLLTYCIFHNNFDRHFDHQTRDFKCFINKRHNFGYRVFKINHMGSSSVLSIECLPAKIAPPPAFRARTEDNSIFGGKSTPRRARRISKKCCAF